MINKNNDKFTNYDAYLGDTKIIIFFIIVFQILKFNKLIKNEIKDFNDNYLVQQKYLNISFNNNLSNKIKIGIYTYSIKNGGRARITSILTNNLNKIKIFKIFLFTKIFKEKNEYIIPENIKRAVIRKNLINFLKKYKINCLIYELDDINEINFLILDLYILMIS